jgi:hypothetical protein
MVGWVEVEEDIVGVRERRGIQGGRVWACED